MKTNTFYLSQLINYIALFLTASGAVLFTFVSYQSLQIPRLVLIHFTQLELHFMRLFFYDTIINSVALALISVGLLIEFLRHRGILSYVGLFLLLLIVVGGVGFATEATRFFNNVDKSNLLTTEIVFKFFLSLLLVFYGLELVVFLKIAGTNIINPLTISLALFFMMALVALGVLMPHWEKLKF